MARFVFASLLVLAVFAQIAVMPAVESFQILPNLPLVLLFVWSSIRGVREGLAWAFGLGLLYDILALDPLGSNGLALLVVVLLGGLSARRFFHSRLVFPILLVIVATVLHGVVMLVVRNTEGGAAPIGAIIRPVFAQAMLNAILVPPCYWLAGMVGRDRMVMRHA